MEYTFRKVIRRNATKQMERILKSVTRVEVFNSQNDYKGGTFGKAFDEKAIKSIIEDLQGGQANLCEMPDGTYYIRYAFPCYWKMTAGA